MSKLSVKHDLVSHEPNCCRLVCPCPRFALHHCSRQGMCTKETLYRGSLSWAIFKEAKGTFKRLHWRQFSMSLDMREALVRVDLPSTNPGSDVIHQSTACYGTSTPNKHPK